MSSELLMNNNDLSYNLYGDLDIVYNDNEILQSVTNLILTKYGENKYHKNMGNQALMERYKMTPNDMESVASDCMNAILYDKRVRQVDHITATKSKFIYGACDIKFIITTINGNRLSNSITVDVMREDN